MQERTKYPSTDVINNLAVVNDASDRVIVGAGIVIGEGVGLGVEVTGGREGGSVGTEVGGAVGGEESVGSTAVITQR